MILGTFCNDFGEHFGVVLSSRARYAISAETSTALTRKQDFGVSRGLNNGPQMVPKPASGGNLAPEVSWGLLGLSWRRLGASRGGLASHDGK